MAPQQASELGGPCLQNAQRSVSWDDTHEPKPSGGKQISKFLPGPLFSTGSHHQHLDIKRFGRNHAGLVRNHHFAKQHASSRGKLVANQAEDFAAMLVTPVVDNVLEKVCIASG